MIVLPLEEMQKTASQKFNLDNISLEFLGSFIHNTLSFETDGISQEEVDDILRGNLKDYPEKQILVVQNQKDAFMYVINLVKNKQELNENTLKDLHEMLMKDVTVGGLYRNVDISIKGSNHTPPSHLKVYDRMKKYFETLQTFGKDQVFDLSGYSYLQLSKIHPFLDGNGRCARLVLIYHLLNNGLLPVNIPYTEKEKHFECVENYKVNKSIQPFVEYLKELEMKEIMKVQ